MIPTVILVGLVAGGALGHQRLRALGAVGLLGSLLWGVGVALGADDPAVFVGGTALATVNFAVGALTGVGVGRLLRPSR